MPWVAHAFGHNFLHPQAGVQGGVGVLKDGLHLLGKGLARFAPEAVDVLAPVEHLSAGLAV